MSRKAKPSLEWVKFYHHDWRDSESVQKMTLEQRGLYITLLMLQPIYGTLPAEERQISRITGVDLRQIKRILPGLLSNFEQVEIDGEMRLANPRMREVMEEHKASREKGLEAARRGRKTPVPEAENGSDSGAEVQDITRTYTRTRTLPPEGGRRGDSHSFSSSDSNSFSGSGSQTARAPEPEPEAAAGGGDGGEGAPQVSTSRGKKSPGSGEEPPGFTEFYRLYPRRVSPRTARQAYVAEITTPELHERLMAGTRRALKGLFRDRPMDKIPYPATWIRSETWKDERSQLDLRPEEKRGPAASGHDDGELPDLMHLADNSPPAWPPPRLTPAA